MAGPFCLPRIDWGKGVGQVEASVVLYGQVGMIRTVENGRSGW